MTNMRKSIHFDKWIGGRFFVNYIGRRFWESRQFYSAYIALFIAITNWITIQYKLLLEHVPFIATVFSNVWIFTIAAIIVFTIASILGGHYVHRKRQFRLEQAVAIEENPYLYKAQPGKERDLMIPIAILQLEVLEELLRKNDVLSEEKKEQFQQFKATLMILAKGEPIVDFRSKSKN